MVFIVILVATLIGARSVVHLPTHIIGLIIGIGLVSKNTGSRGGVDTFVFFDDE